MTAVTTPAELLAKHKAGEKLELIDVRMPTEYREAHVEFARNVPLDQLDPQKLLAERGASDKPLYFVCKSGGRSKMACDKFAAAGFNNAVSVEGGTSACIAAGLPAVKGQKAMSLERQVRIAAGSLVLLGVGLSFVHPYFIGLSAFVGAGLVFAGITDTCGMGMMLARMPWNQVPSEAAGKTTCAAP